MPVHARVMCRALPCLAGSSAPPASLCGFCLLTWLNRQPSQRRSTEPGEPALRRPLRFETDPARWARGQARVGSKGDPFGAASGMIFDSFGCQVASLRAAQRPPGCGRSPGFPLRSLRAERAAAVESARWLRGSPDMSLHPISPLCLGLVPATLAVARCAQRTLRADALFAERGGRLGPQAGAGPTYEALVSTAVDLKVEHVVVLEQVDGPLPPQGGPRCQTAF